MSEKPLHNKKDSLMIKYLELKKYCGKKNFLLVFLYGKLKVIFKNRIDIRKYFKFSGKYQKIHILTMKFHNWPPLSTKNRLKS